MREVTRLVKAMGSVSRIHDAVPVCIRPASRANARPRSQSAVHIRLLFAFSLTLRALGVKRPMLFMSSPVRNVPILISLEVSPFWVLGFCSFVSRRSCFCFGLGSSPSLASAGAKPCGARRAERLGRSGGRGQRRRPGRPGQIPFPVSPPPGMLGPGSPLPSRRRPESCFSADLFFGHRTLLDLFPL